MGERTLVPDPPEGQSVCAQTAGCSSEGQVGGFQVTRPCIHGRSSGSKPKRMVIGAGVDAGQCDRYLFFTHQHEGSAKEAQRPRRRNQLGALAGDSSTWLQATVAFWQVGQEEEGEAWVGTGRARSCARPRAVSSCPASGFVVAVT